MDNIIDPELASEMVKLLAQELKSVRTQLRDSEMRNPRLTSATPSTHESTQALISENNTLKADNVALQERIAILQNELSHVGSVKLEEGTEMSIFHMRQEFARLIAENQELTREKQEALRNQEKLTIIYDKYQRTKAAVQEYNEIMNELRDALSNCTEELEQTRKAAVTQIDFRDFLKNTPYEPVEGQLELSSIPTYDRGVHAKLCEDVRKGLFCISPNEVIWSSSGIAFGLVVKPAFQYNPKHRGGSWIKVEVNFGDRMDVCYLSGKSGKTSRYLGTYERVPDQGLMTIAPRILQHLDHSKLNYATGRTTLHSDLVPPSQMNMIKNMYKQGVIELQCFGIRYIAMNQTFVQELRDLNAFPTNLNSPVRTIIPSPGVPNRDTRKRKRDSSLMVQSKRKRKGPSSNT